jgi:hypothetical protein
MRKLIKEADPDVVEEWKWMGTAALVEPAPVHVAVRRLNIP